MVKHLLNFSEFVKCNTKLEGMFQSVTDTYFYEFTSVILVAVPVEE